MDTLVAIVFLLTYLGMAAGGLPGIKVDRSWIAFAAAATLLVSSAISLPQAGDWIHWDALLLLFGMMVISAQFQLSGLYDRLGDRVAGLAAQPHALLAAVIMVSGTLSAVLINDVAAFALAPVLVIQLRRLSLDPTPYLLALACACNAGSAATLIGNPQNILIGQAGALNFWGYLAFAIVPSMLALLTVFGVIAWLWRGRWQLPTVTSPATVTGASVPLKPWVAVAILLLLFTSPVPRELSVLMVALGVMASRHHHSRDYVAAVDWNLLLLFVGLFVVTGAASELPWAGEQVAALTTQGLLPQSAIGLAGASLLGSNLIGNVPFVVLLLQVWPDISPLQLQALALLTTLAGNLLLVGSVVNLIVAESARRHGVVLSFFQFARVGVPVTLLSMAIAVVWIALIHGAVFPAT